MSEEKKYYKTLSKFLEEEYNFTCCENKEIAEGIRADVIGIRDGSASVGTWNYKNAKGFPYSYIEQPEIVVVEVKTYKTGFSRLIA